MNFKAKGNVAGFFLFLFLVLCLCFPFGLYFAEEWVDIVEYLGMGINRKVGIKLQQSVGKKANCLYGNAKKCSALENALRCSLLPLIPSLQRVLEVT